MRSWKWWVYGDINSQSQVKPLKVYRRQLFICIFGWIFIAAHPWLSTWINRNPPKFSDLQIAHGKVISTHYKNPHLILCEDSGEILEMEFPSFMNNYGRSTVAIRKFGKDNKNALGCRATVWFDTPSYTLWQRYRVWQFKCDDRELSASYNQIINNSGDMGLVLYGFGAFILYPLLTAMWFVRFMRGSYD